MFQAISGVFNPPSPQPGSPVQSSHVNMTPRAARQKSTKKDDSSVVQLQNQLKTKDSIIASLQAKLARLEDDTMSQSSHHTNNNNSIENVERRKHPLTTVQHMITDRGRVESQLGTRGSMLTKNILEAQCDPSKTPIQQTAEKFIQVFQSPVDYLPYLQSVAFAADLLKVCEAVGDIFEEGPRCLFMQSPVYVFGDIHGNLEDLHFFADNIWKIGMDLTAGQFLFLGDYVDRGMSCLECVSYLFGLKLLFPNKIHLLRGNHETRDVNGWEEHYQEKSFLYQCKDRFGVELGNKVWEQCNLAFDRMPLAAVIDHEIFCIHGGIPRPVDEFESEIQAVLALPSVASVMPPYDHEAEWMKRVSSDCLWSDPAPENMEPRLHSSGFGDSPRGGGAVMFGHNAIENFLASNSLSYIIRAHEAHAHGVALSKGARVFTVFSTSKDHRQGSRAMAGCILVDFDKIQVINRSPKYSNKYVHRRTSISLDNISLEEIDERARLGLVRLSTSDEEGTKMRQEIARDNAREKMLKEKINNSVADTSVLLDCLGKTDSNSSATTHHPTF